MISQPSASGFKHLGILGQGLEAFGILQTGQQMGDAYDYNAAIAREKAKAASYSGELTTFQQEKNLESLIGRQRAQYAAAGVKVDTGSPLDVMVDTLAKGHLDMAITKYNDSLAVRSYEAEAAMNEYTKRQTRRESLLQAGVSLFKGAL